MGTDIEILGLITARGGSKSVPRKNLAEVGGKPLVAWTIEAALESRGLSRVIVSTEDNEIAEICRQWGADVPFIRPPELAQDESSHISVVLHTLDWLESHEGALPDYLMVLQPTSLLRTTEDIDGAIRVAHEKQDDGVVSVCETHHHPYLTKRIAGDGTLEDFVSDGPKQGSSSIRRQVLPAAYFVNGAIFLNRCEVLRSTLNFVPPSTVPYIMPAERSLQIDGPWDLHIARLVLERRLVDAVGTIPLGPGKQK